MNPEALRKPWTLTGNVDAERAITADLQRITEQVRAVCGDSLSALILVGSYARGEGAVQKHKRGWVGHNDFDLVCVMKTNFVRRLHLPLRKLAELLREQVHVDVDLWPISQTDLANAPQTLFWLDVAMGGGRVLFGDRTVLDVLKGRSSRQLAMDECARLLANRATGLALSRLGGTWAQPEIMLRHMHKAVLACGDARLLAVHRYAATLAERSENLRKLCAEHPTLHQLPALYEQAIAYRSAPNDWKPAGGIAASSGMAVSDWYTQTGALVSKWHLSFESWRVGVQPEPAQYARFQRPLYGHSQDLRGVRSVIHSLKTSVRTKTLHWAHPREQLARASVAIAYAPTEQLALLCKETLFCETNTSLQALERLVHLGG